MSYITKSNTVLYFIISTILIFIGIILGQFISNPELRGVYWLLFFLLFITFSNIYLSIIFYKMLRDNPGIKGDRGDPGEKGPSGPNGVCSMTTQCKIANCRGLIEKELGKIYPQYKQVLSKRKQRIMLNSSDKRILSQVNSYVDSLLPDCEGGKFSKEEFINTIPETLETIISKK